MQPIVVLPPPSMPTGILIALSGASLLVMIFTCMATRNSCVRALAIAFWFRYLLSAWHQITFKPAVGGLSLNALGSCAVIAAIVLLLGHRSVFSKYVAPFVWFIAAITISAIVNARYAGGVNSIIKVTYLICVANLAYHAMMQKGLQHTMTTVAVAFFLPLSLQATSIAIGLRKATEQDGSASYIGGYFHEAVFSIMLVTFLFVAVFFRRVKLRNIAILCWGLVGLILANYRTSILSVIPILLYYLVKSSVSRIRKDQRVAAATVAFLIGGVIIVAFVATNSDRFVDILTGLGKGVDLFKSPEWFAKDERQLFSGRAYIWSLYLTAWLRGDASVILFGYGPDAWQGLFVVYAHNTFVSYIYEYGLFGLVGIGIIFVSYIKRAFSLRGDQRNLSTVAASGFLILNMATMPLWQVEGNLLFAILLAQVWHAHSLERSTRRVQAVARQSARQSGQAVA